MLLRGRKRFRLAPPGAVEALQATSTKYDRVSVMATASLDALRARTGPDGTILPVAKRQTKSGSRKLVEKHRVQRLPHFG